MGRSDAINPRDLSQCATCSVRDLSICGTLSAEELDRLEAIVTRTSVRRGQTLFYEGDAAASLFIVTGGIVKLHKLLIDGRCQITGFVFPGDFLGLAFRNKYAYSAEPVTRTVSVCRFARSEFETLMQEMPHLEIGLLRSAANELAAAQDQMLLLGRKSVAERVASFLVLLSRREARHGRDRTLVDLPMTRSDIGDYLGLTLESVSREFSRLKRSEIIALPDAHEVRLLDPAGLTATAGLEPDPGATGFAGAPAH